MNKQEIISLVKRLDTANSLEQETAWAKLRLLQEQVVPLFWQVNDEVAPV